MFRNQYDSDVTVFSPQGRLHQVDYAVEAMRQGSATVAIQGKDHAVVVALMRAQNELSAFQEKIFSVDEHLGLSMSGLLADGRILAREVQRECAAFRHEFGTPISIQEIRSKLGQRLQKNTQYYGSRPFGVGLLLIGYDDLGPHVLKAEPSGMVTAEYAAAIGARSQSARTYLEKHMDAWKDGDLDTITKHALLALKETLQAYSNKLDQNNTAVAIVGSKQKFIILGGDKLKEHLNKIPENGGQGGQPETMQIKMSTNWAELRKELKVITKQSTAKAAQSNSRKRKIEATPNKWKKARQEIAASNGPTNENNNRQLVTKILALDCEYVGVGTGGLDDMLARVSIVNEEGAPVYDQYVVPTEEVVDYRTEVSGIRPGHLKRGIAFTQVQSEVRKILSDNIVIGHSLHNDFRVLGITHPPKLIRDTAKFKPLRETLDNPKKMPSLKLLAHHLLGVQIQQGEHDSIMDATIALRIYLQHRNKWEQTVKLVKKKK